MPQTVSHTVSLTLAALGGAFVYAVLVSKGLLAIPSPNAPYLLTVAFIAFVNAVLFASVKNVGE